VDLRFPDDAPTPAELRALDAVVPATVDAEGWQREHGGAHQAEARRHLLLPALHALQDATGWVSPGGLGELCRRLDVPPAEGYGVASFYALFETEAPVPRVVHVCTDLACQTRGAAALVAGLEAELGPAGTAHPVDGGTATWTPSACLGLCERAPAAIAFQAGEPAHESVLGSTTVAEVVVAVRNGASSITPEPEPAAATPQVGGAAAAPAGLVLLSRVGRVDPTSLDDYRAHGGYAALRAAVAMGPSRVIREVTDANLVGRGGAAFPAGRKWQAVASQPADPHYLVCNADESEPGTFKDRVVLEGDPFSVVEAMTIAGWATGCATGYVYLRGEYPRALAHLQGAIDAARARGFLGPDVMGLGFGFDITIVRGAGAYICGEETAIFNSIEGYRGEPRSKPPFPVEVGLFAKPTLVNNVETLVNVLPILRGGGPAFAAIGTPTSTGTKLFCVSGSVRSPGVYEVPFGATLRDVLDLAGGTEPGRELRAVLLGGAAGSFVPADRIDLPLTIEGARAAGTTLGSGVVLAIDDSVDLTAFVGRIAEFFRDESCGQCVPCRVGTVRQEEAFHRIVIGRRSGADATTDLQILRDVGQVMRDASICGLGQAAWNAIESAIDTLGVLS
jgi:NADH-quinone oxidoreductase subunit F